MPRSIPRPVAVVCPTRRIPLLAPGGASHHLRSLAGGFAAAGARTELWGARRDRGGDVPTVAPPPAVRVRVATRGRLPGALRRRSRAWDVRVDVAAMARQAGRWADELGVELIYERLALFGAIGGRIRRRTGAAWVVEVNAPVAWEAAWFEGMPPSPRLFRGIEATVQAADHVVAVSDVLAEYLVARRGVKPDRVTVLPNGSDAAPPSGGGRDGAGSFVLGYEGTFKPWQGLLPAVSGLSELARSIAPRHLRLELWGDGPERAPLLEALPGCVDVRVRGWGTPDRGGWDAAWIPHIPWPPPGTEELVDGFGEPAPAVYFSPLKAAVAGASRMPVVRYASVEPAPPVPARWSEVAGKILGLTGLAGHEMIAAAR